jgi:hypothetical protein
MRFQNNGSRRTKLGVARAIVVATTVLVGCGGLVHEETGTTKAAIAGPITISGTLDDANGLPLPNATVLLFGPKNGHEQHEDPNDALATVTTGPDGKYSFAGLEHGSYLVKPHVHECRFEPRDADFDKISADVTQDFSGSGAGCGGQRTVGFGATSGSLTITGHVRDASGHPVIGGEVTLGGDVQAARFTDFTGAYTFLVDPGSYSLAASGACSIAPANVSLHHVTANTVQDFAATSSTCVFAVQSEVTSTGSILTVQQNGQVLGATYAHIETYASAADALTRLQQIGSELSTPSTSLTIAGYPAIERQAVIVRPSIDPDLVQLASGFTAPLGPPPINLTSAIAAGTTVLRFETQLPSNATAAAILAVFVPARNFDPSTLSGVHGPAPTPIPLAPDVPPATPVTLTPPEAPSTVTPNTGELQIAASDSANAVIYGTQNAVSRSVDNGVTVTASTVNLSMTPPNGNLFGDPTVAVGAPNGLGQQAFWYAQLAQTGTTTTMPTQQVISVELLKSTDNGATFNTSTIAFPVNCSSNVTCQVTDWEKIAVDRLHQANSMQQRFDQVYVTWRNFTSATSSTGVGVACSANEGATAWTIDTTTLAGGTDFARPTVAQDGSLLVLFSSGDGSGNGYTLKVQKFQSCSAGFAAQGGPVTVASPNEVSDLAGLDRPPVANYDIAADLSQSTAQTSYVTYLNQTGTGNDDIHVIESTDGTAHWNNDVTVNSVHTGNRFFPAICTTNGTAYVSWYDRGGSGSTTPDLTAYHRSSVTEVMSALQAGADINVSGVNDPECASGFPGGNRSPTEETACGTNQDLPGSATNPVNAGTCCPSGNNANNGTCCPPGVAQGSPMCTIGAPCDFRFGCASTTTTCINDAALNGSPPKFGDYNGNACAQGVVYMAWASSTAPTGLACTLTGLACTTNANCCTNNCVGNVCAPSASACTANGQACAGGGCCSGVCQGGQCLPAVNVFEASSALVSCTTATPDVATFTAPFDVDTGLSGGVGTNYGNGTCPNQFLVEADLTQPAFQGHDFSVVGGWSSTLPATPCNEQATMDVYTFNGSTWQLYDEVVYAPVSSGGLCIANAVSHTNPGSQGLGGTDVPAASNFQKVRAAVKATQNGNKVPVVVFGQAL